ncbi:hypothetical protein [Amycolatopsis keratiniphila]|uniref:AMP-binding enzyme C-terminal domain-containing protein n=1 Tax=Amycolatopsis keratiniphila TaxID=129921 RepID=R4T6R0_9PSEU|nr:hypothetical protein [Amycolatopsis keratiniphila]AGM08076.1 hypothetical protein AORI_5493 [Amycolatopsis keratiniphila]
MLPRTSSGKWRRGEVRERLFASYEPSTDQADNDLMLAALCEGDAVQQVVLSTELRGRVVTRYAEAKAVLLDSRLRKDPATLSDPALLFDGGRHPEDS